MPIILDPRDTETAIAGNVNSDLFAPQPPLDSRPKPGFLDVMAAASRQSTIAGAAYERLANPNPDLPDAPPGYDALDHIAGYEDHAPLFVNADTPSEVAGIKSRIDSTKADHDVLQRVGWGGPGAEIAMNLLDPSFLAAAAVPELALAKSARLSSALNVALKGGAGAAAYETAMQSIQEDRSGLQSALNIGAGALLSGVIGSISRHVPPAELEAAHAEARAAIQVNPNPGEQSFGAAGVRAPTTLEAESFTPGGNLVSKVAGAIPFAQTDLGLVMQSSSVEARQVLQDLADVRPLLNKNTEGLITPTSVESLVGRQEARAADFAHTLSEQWVSYRDRVPAAERMARSDFEAAVAGAARRSDEDVVPEIATAARALRSGVFDPLKVEAQRLGLLPKDVQVVGAESYYRRMYDREAIRTNRALWDETLIRHFQGGGAASRAEAAAATEDVTRSILGADVGQSNFGFKVTVPTAGPLRERVLTIPDEYIEKFLVNDPVKVAKAYLTDLAPQIEITKRFGDKDMTEAFDRVRAEYDIKREQVRAGTETADHSTKLSALTGEEQKVLEALKRVRDRIYGRAGRLAPDAGAHVRVGVNASRTWRALVASGRLGATAITTMPQDTARIIGRFGYARTMGKLMHLVSSPTFRRLSTDQARHLGAAVEVTMARRVSAAFDGAITEGWAQKLAQGVYKYSGLNHWNDFARTLAASLLEDEILHSAEKVSAGGALEKITRTRLASIGLDETALRAINTEVGHQNILVDSGGIRRSNSGHWADAELAGRYDAAILKESRNLVQQAGAAGHSKWLDSELGKVLGQLKSFAIDTPLTMTAIPFQLIGQREYMLAARFVGAMMIGGYLSHVLRQIPSGKEPTTDLAGAAGEAFSEAGLGGLLPDLSTLLGRRFNLFGESARYSDRNVYSAIGGPAVGTFADAYDILYNRTQNGLSAADLHAIRRLLPYQNLWWLRRAINALEGETAEALGLQGATSQSFAERFAETTPLLPTKQRGGTGTGRPVQ